MTQEEVQKLHSLEWELNKVCKRLEQALRYKEVFEEGKKEGRKFRVEFIDGLYGVSLVCRASATEEVEKEMEKEREHLEAEINRIKAEIRNL